LISKLSQDLTHQKS